MIDELKRIEKTIFKISNLKITNLLNEKECEEYLGFNFCLDKLNVKFRKAKITPKKVGQFVTLWKRNSNKQTEPFTANDNFDFCIITTEQDNEFGFFFFPKSVLIKNQILTTNVKIGKRGFRLYPNWTKTENKQAEKTKSWQSEYFIDLNNEVESIQKFNLIFTLFKDRKLTKLEFDK